MIYIFTGEINSGKTNSLLKWSKEKPYIFGILTPKNEKRERYFLDLNSGITFKMEANEFDVNTISVGPYLFKKESFDLANQILGNTVKKLNKGFLIIDELGKLELLDSGLYKSIIEGISLANKNEAVNLILVIRHSLLNDAINKFKLAKAIVINNTIDLNRTL